MKLGYIGLGNMGGALARRLMREHQLRAFDLRPEVLGRFAEAGAVPTQSAQALARESDLIMTCLPTSAEVRDVQAGARSLGLETDVLNASTESDIDKAFANIAQRRPNALIVGTDPFFLAQRDQLARLAAHHAVPAMYHLREFVEAGGLVSYGPSIVAAYVKAGVYTGQILNGVKPADFRRRRMAFVL